MSADADDSPTEPESATPPPEAGSGEPVPCSACRGTGEVISNLGGTPQRVSCPWCDGGGIRLTGHDAQAAQLARRETDGEAGAPAQQSGDGDADRGAGDGEPPDQVA